MEQTVLQMRSSGIFSLRDLLFRGDRISGLVLRSSVGGIRGLITDTRVKDMKKAVKKRKALLKPGMKMYPSHPNKNIFEKFSIKNFGFEQPLPPGEKKFIKVRRHDIADVFNTVPVRIMNWNVDYAYRLQDERMKRIVSIIQRTRADAVFLHNTSHLKDKSSTMDQLEVLKELLVDTNEYELLLYEEGTEKNPYGYPAILTKKSEIELRGFEVEEYMNTDSGAYHLKAHTLINTEDGKVPLFLYSTRFSDYGASLLVRRRVLEAIHSEVSDIPMPTIVGLDRAPTFVKCVRSLSAERRGICRSFSDAFRRAGAPDILKYTTDPRKNPNHPPLTDRRSYSMNQPLRQTRLYLSPGSGAEKNRPVLRNFFFVGAENLLDDTPPGVRQTKYGRGKFDESLVPVRGLRPGENDTGLYPSGHFGIVTDLLIPISSTHVLPEHGRNLILAGEIRGRSLYDKKLRNLKKQVS